MMSARIVFGAGALARLPALLPAGARIALLTGGRTLRASGVWARVVGLVEQQARLAVTWAVPSHPDWQSYQDAMSAVRGAGATQLLALGGGSVLDVAKHVATEAAPSCELLAVPTLFGSGAEVTPFVTVWDRATLQKRSLPARPCQRVLVDPLLALSAPPAVRAAPLLDCLAHGADVLWQAGSAGRARARAATAVRLVRAAFADALSGETRALCRVAAASLLGGLAIGESGSGPSHALSYPLQLRFRVPHGLGCALALLWLLRAFPERAPAALVAALGAPGPESAARLIASLIERAGLPAELSSYGASADDLDLVAAEADRERLARAGIHIAPESLAKLLREVASPC